MAQDDYQYEIQLSNKQLVFYFMAGATALILSFLMGVAVGKGVNSDLNPRQVVSEPPVVTVDAGPAATEPSPAPSYTFPQRLESNRVPDRLESRPATVNATPRATPQRPTPTPPPATPSPTVTPPPKATPTPAPPAPTVRPTPRPSAPGGHVTLQVGAFKDEKAAESLKARLAKNGFPVAVVPRPERDFAVRVGPYASRAEAEQVKKRLLAQEKLSSFVVTQ